MAGLYIHIPFCRQACHYCDFHFSTHLETMESLVDALVAEATLRLRAEDTWNDLSFNTLYLGGGTPSLLPATLLKRLVLGVTQTLGIPLSSLHEFTLEANPEDMTEDNLKAWMDLGVGRLSVGVQTFDDATLRWMNRAHTGKQAIDALVRAQHCGMESLSVDLIYGVPTTRDWEFDVRTALDLPLTHLSAYALTVEPNTVLGVRVGKGEQQEAPESHVVQAYNALCDRMRSAGWEHYETSNWAAPAKTADRPFHRALHNSSYWSGKPYLALGPGAHGFHQATRYANVANNNRYIRSIQQGVLDQTVEHLTDVDRYNEALMTGLRTADGISPQSLEQSWALRPDVLEPAMWSRLIQEGRITSLPEGRYRIPETHWITGDQVASSLFCVSGT